MKPLAEQNLYELLELPPDAREDDIVKAWDRLNALCAPGSLATYTLVAQEDAALLGRRLEEALTVLLDPVARERYDASLSLTPAPRAASSAEASVSGPESPSRPRPVPEVHRPRALPPIIPPLREVPTPSAPATPIALERVSASAEAPAPAEAPAAGPAAAAAPIPLVTPLPCTPPFAAVTPLPATLPAVPPPAAAPLAAAGPEPLLGEPGRYTGDALRRAREARGITLPQLCERTKITRHHLENLEADRYERLPAAVYLRGMLMALSKELRLDGQKVARSYLDAMAAAAPPAPPPPPRATQR
ncbi:helix-turn-helix domain-containing protein [Anaeromyxobacter diazotrophicus]|uniref:Uncharacterized protein n=1 Tax=Anaeromyxobacter diazotrophicus TaxID=2590199 RepID=A0A7I9VQ45_9BACT|nr:helix-turn-helix domain-containing protein [Anaeromyxobacter diazotrophicus]GEJ58358.1 hypothetical protein AMYX_30990 [Anaeromyxobacter diazotrophicus]